MKQINKNSISVIILCGGAGTRLKEETEYKPKPMVTIGGKPILWHIMKGYSHYGFNNFILCLGYKGDYIKNYFLNYKWFHSDFQMNINKEKTLYKINHKYNDDFNIIFAETGLETMTGERIKMVKEYVHSDLFMVTYGDGVSNVNLDALLNFHNAHQNIGTITGVHPTSKYGLVSADETNIISSFSQKPKLNEYINGGFMIFGREFFKYLKPEQMIEDALVDLINERELLVYKHDDFWHSMDTYKDYEELNAMWHSIPRWKIWQN